MSWSDEGFDISEMIGQTFVDVVSFNDALFFVTADGMRYKFEHNQDCCENVVIEDLVGDLKDLVGTPILMAESPEGVTEPTFEDEYEPESYTWTFYKFATIKGYVDVRWLGTSNGYYGEGVSLSKKLVE